MKALPRRSMIAFALALAMGGLAACLPTAGVPITLGLAFESLSDGSVVTPSGWDVELDEAVLLLGPIHVYAPLDEGLDEGGDGARSKGPLLRPPRSPTRTGASTLWRGESSARSGWSRPPSICAPWPSRPRSSKASRGPSKS